MPHLKQNMTDSFGLSDEVLGLLRETFARFEKVDAVVVFGSRAIGNYRPGLILNYCRSFTFEYRVTSLQN